jgi:hypothetical protein
MCRSTFDAELGDRLLEIPSNQGIMFLPLVFRQRYDGHRYALDRVHRGRDCRLLLTRKLVHEWNRFEDVSYPA